MSLGIFITGTNTGIGKTIITAGILRILRKEGVDAVPMKPVQTGALQDNAGSLQTDLVALPTNVNAVETDLKVLQDNIDALPNDMNVMRSPDLDFCLNAACLTPSRKEYKLMCPYLYKPACSPHLAGRTAGYYPEIKPICRNVEKLGIIHEVVVVEGAGGVFVPLDENLMMTDLMKALGLPVIIVAETGLGTINHTLLTIHALRSAGLDILGVIMNDTEEPGSEFEFIRKDNSKAVEHFGNIKILGQVPFIKDIQNTGKDNHAWKEFTRGLYNFSLIKDVLTG